MALQTQADPRIQGDLVWKPSWSGELLMKNAALAINSLDKLESDLLHFAATGKWRPGWTVEIPHPVVKQFFSYDEADGVSFGVKLKQPTTKQVEKFAAAWIAPRRKLARRMLEIGIAQVGPFPDARELERVFSQKGDTHCPFERRGFDRAGGGSREPSSGKWWRSRGE